MEPVLDSLLEFVSLDGVASQVPTGQTIRAKVVWRNSSADPIVVARAVITGLAPGATQANGPYDDFTPAIDDVTVGAGETLTLSASLLPPAELGGWTVFPSYFGRDGRSHNFTGNIFTIVSDSEYGTFANSIWPISDAADPPNEDHRFAYACYTRSPTSGVDSAVCRARYGLGTLPYQVNPSNLPTIQQQCEQDGGIFLPHACPTNQMLQLCWEDTRSPAWSFACEYYGDPNNKSPQFPGAAPDIVFYNDRYLGRNPPP